MSRLTYLALTCATLLTLAACSDNDADEAWDSVPADKVAVELTIRMKVSTLADYDVDNPEEAGTAWENYIDMHGDDYRIYFFTSDKTEGNNTLIAELEPTSVTSTSGSQYVTYTIWGELDGSFAATTDFKVVVAANWGEYPTVTTSTTMQTLCNAGTYSALVDTDTDGNTKAVMPSSSKHIPFYGVQEYSGVTWKLGHTTSLSGGITMVRAMAKVEVVLNDDERSFSSVTLNRYNATGYCAPSYYDATTTSVTYDLHIPSNAKNDGSIAFVKTQERGEEGSEQYETWTVYIPEYDNSSTDYSTITATFNKEDGSLDDEETTITIYFGNYSGGVCTAYDTTGNTADRFDISRNYYYRFSVSNPNSIAGAASSRSRNSLRRAASPLTVTSQAVSLY